MKTQNQNMPKSFVDEQKRTSHGFTILEILIVISVFGVILVIAGISVTRMREKARVSEAQSQLEMIEVAVRQLAWDTGQWPGHDTRTTKNREMWDLNVPAAGLVATDGSYPDWKGPYIASVPEDPWGRPYFFDGDYHVPDGSIRSVVGSFGPTRPTHHDYGTDNIYILVDD